MRAVWCAGAIALSAGCGDNLGPEDVDGSLPSEASLVVGSTSLDRKRFVEVEDGADVPLVAGSQGGFHVWTGLRLRGAAGRLRVEREARRTVDEELVLRAPTMFIEAPPAAMSSWWERPGGEEPEAIPSFMCPTPIGLRVRDEPLRLRIQVESAEGVAIAEDSLVVVPRCPTDDEALAEFCVEICSG